MVEQKELWHYISMGFLPETVKEERPAPTFNIPFYWDTPDPQNGDFSVAFLPVDKIQIKHVLDHLGLKSATWKKGRNFVIATNVTQLNQPKLKKADLVKLYVELRSKISEQQVERVRRDLEVYRKDAKDRLRSLTENYKQIAELSKQLDDLITGDNNKEELKAELDIIMKLNMVKKVEVQRGQLVVHTKVIEVKNVPLGEFKIFIDLVNGVVVNIVNKTPIHFRYEYRHHPHVQGSKTRGEPCWGNIIGTIAELAATRDIPTLVSVVIDWLSLYNPKNAYQGIFELFRKRYENGLAKKKSEEDVHVAQEVAT